MKNTSIVLMHYPVVDVTMERINEVVTKKFDLVVVTNVRAGSLLNLIKMFLNQEYEDVYIYVDKESGAPLIPALTLFSLLFKARSRYLLSLEDGGQKIDVLDVSRSCLQVLLSAVGSVGILPISFAKIWMLRRKPRSRLRPTRGIDATRYLYLRTILWLGVRNGGAVTHTEGVIKGLVRKKIEVSLISPSGEFVSIQSRKFKTTDVPFPGAYIIPRELNMLRYGRRISNALKNYAKDFNGVIYQRNSSADISGVEFARKRGLPLVIEFNGSESWLSKHWGARLNLKWLVENAERVTLRHAHAVVAVSDVLRKQLIQLGVEPGRIICVPNGYDPDLFQGASVTPHIISKLRKLIDPDGNATIVTFVGTFGPWHGADILAMAAQKILRGNAEENQRFKFVFVGDGGGLELVRRIASECNSDSSFKFTGLIPRQDVVRYCLASDVLVNPTKENPDKSDFFGSPTKLFEYMGAGRLIITSNLGQIPEVVRNGVTATQLDELDTKKETSACGIWVPPNDAESLATSILWARQNKHWCECVGKNAREYAEKNFVWDCQVDKISRHVESMIENDTKKVRVLINALHAKSGGGITYLKNLLPLLKCDDRLELHICLGSSQLELFDTVLQGISVHLIDRGVTRLAVLATEQIEVPMIAHKISADVIFSPANFGPLAFPNTVILLRNALSVAFVESRFGKRFYWLMLCLTTYISAALSSRIISVSSYAHDTSLLKSMRNTHSKVSIVPHGVNEIFKPPNAAQRDKNMLLFVSDIYVQKNLHSLIGSMPRILKEFPEMKLHIAGASIDQEYAQSLRDLADSLGVAEQIVYEGSVPTSDLPHLYQTCTLFVFPSTVETFGNSLVEAMACGAVVACSKSAAMPEVAGDAVEYFNPDDIDEIGETICNLLSDRARREYLSERALERAKMYSWKTTAAHTAEILIQSTQQ